MKQITNVLAGILGTIWAVIILALIFSPNPPKSPPEPAVAEAKSDPAQARRAAKALEMLSRIVDLNRRVAVQCKRVGLSTSGCENGLRNKAFELLAGADIDSEVQFTKFVDDVEQYERKLLPFVYKMETTISLDGR